MDQGGRPTILYWRRRRTSPLAPGLGLWQTLCGETKRGTFLDRHNFVTALAGQISKSGAIEYTAKFSRSGKRPSPINITAEIEYDCSSKNL